MNDDDILRDIELSDAISPEERLRRIARLILKAIRLREAKKMKSENQAQPITADATFGPAGCGNWPRQS